MIFCGFLNDFSYAEHFHNHDIKPARYATDFLKTYVKTIADFKKDSEESIIQHLSSNIPYPVTDSLVRSWHELIHSVRSASSFDALPDDMLIGFELVLPIDSTSIDLFFVSHRREKETFYVVESKQWSDDYILTHSFDEFRNGGCSEHEYLPQAQAHRYVQILKKYTRFDSPFDSILAIVYLQNATDVGMEHLRKFCKGPSSRIKATNDLSALFRAIASEHVRAPDHIPSDFYEIPFEPTISIINAMRSLVDNEPPFVLTPEQQQAFDEIINIYRSGKRIIRISGSAGSGKTAVLLHLYQFFLENRAEFHKIPYFASGGQNTHLYRSLYPQVAGLFSWTFVFERNISESNGPEHILFIDEAQSNRNGLIGHLANTGATIIFAYDSRQTVNLDNSVEELSRLSKRPDYAHIKLRGSVRFNNSEVFEENARRCLYNEEILLDDKYYFKICSNMEDLKSEIVTLIEDHQDSTVAVSGLLCNSANSVIAKSGNFFFTNWGNKMETEWVPYVLDKNYFPKYNGSLWVGTWWLPGLDVDYNIVLIGPDVIMTSEGLKAVPEESKLYNAINSVIKRIELPPDAESYGAKKSLQAFRRYTSIPANRKYWDQFEIRFTTLLRNYYYIMLTRGRKGCIVYFDQYEK